MKTDYQRFRVYGRNGCMGEFYSYGFDIESSRNIFALMKKEKVKILYQMPITKICNDGGSIVYENEEAMYDAVIKGDDNYLIELVEEGVNKNMTDTPLTDAEEIVIYGECDRYVYPGFARELERENKRLKKRVVELTEMLIEVRDNPNNNVFEKFEKGVNEI